MTICLNCIFIRRFSGIFILFQHFLDFTFSFYYNCSMDFHNIRHAEISQNNTARLVPPRGTALPDIKRR